MSKTALITGIAGQDGAYLANFLLGKKYRIVGVTMSKKSKELYRLAYFGIITQITLVEGDICDREFMSRIIKKYQPDEFYNLAGISSVAKSWKYPEEMFKVNAAAVLQLLGIIHLISPHTRFFQASSAEIFGPCSTPVSEKMTTFNPLHPYGIAKLAAHLAVKSFRTQYGMFVVNGVLFNHESPLRDDYFVSKVIVRGVARIAQGSKEKIGLGNLAAERDFGFAGDFVRAMWLMLQSKQPRDFIICTSRNFRVQDFVQEAFARIGVKKWRQYVEIVPALIRKQDIKKMRGNSARIQKELRWRPRLNFRQLVKIMIGYELDKIRKGI